MGNIENFCIKTGICSSRTRFYSFRGQLDRKGRYEAAETLTHAKAQEKKGVNRNVLSLL